MEGRRYCGNNQGDETVLRVSSICFVTSTLLKTLQDGLAPALDWLVAVLSKVVVRLIIKKSKYIHLHLTFSVSFQRIQ